MLVVSVLSKLVLTASVLFLMVAHRHELQILFRMEIISLMCELSDHTSATQVLVNEICRLLESIQFNLPGGVLEGESLLDFSNNVIKLRLVHLVFNFL